MSRSILVTGSNGLIGSEVVSYFAEAGWRVYGIDNNMRACFFGPAGDTRWNQERLVSKFSNFTHYELDVRDRQGIGKLMEEVKPSAIVHCAAQPSHDLSALRSLDDFDVNTGGTVNILDATYRYCRDSPFVHL